MHLGPKGDKVLRIGQRGTDRWIDGRIYGQTDSPCVLQHFVALGMLPKNDDENDDDDDDDDDDSEDDDERKIKEEANPMMIDVERSEQQQQESKKAIFFKIFVLNFFLSLFVFHHHNFSRSSQKLYTSSFTHCNGFDSLILDGCHQL